MITAQRELQEESPWLRRRSGATLRAADQNRECARGAQAAAKARSAPPPRRTRGVRGLVSSALSPKSCDSGICHSKFLRTEVHSIPPEPRFRLSRRSWLYAFAFCVPRATAPSAAAIVMCRPCAYRPGSSRKTGGAGASAPRSRAMPRNSAARALSDPDRSSTARR